MGSRFAIFNSKARSVSARNCIRSIMIFTDGFFRQFQPDVERRLHDDLVHDRDVFLRAERWRRAKQERCGDDEI